MITHIIKRDERKVPFTIDKIVTAVYRAAESIGKSDMDMATDIASETCKLYESTYGDEVPTVDIIQDLVEKTLMENGQSDVAKAYILYRHERSRERELKTGLMKTMNELTFNFAKDSDIKRENANINGDTAMGTMLKYGSSAAKAFYELSVLNPEHAEAHRNGDIHIHDFDFYTLTTTCTQIDLIKLLKGGFSTGHGFLREPNDIISYSALACIAIQSNQNDQHGGQSIPTFDYAMAVGVAKTFARKYKENLAKGLELVGQLNNAVHYTERICNDIKEAYNLIPTLANMDQYEEIERKFLSEYLGPDNIATIQSFARKSAVKETERATYQAMEAFIHNLNTMHSRAGAQVPFSSINYGTDTSPEGRMVIRNILLAESAGLGNGETPIFPIHIFKVKEGINYNEGDPNYDLFKLACKVSAKRLFPNFSFIDAPFNLQYYRQGEPETEIAYMGCRTRVIGNTFDPTNEIVTGRGNLSFTSINLPRIAIESNHNIEKFYELLDKRMSLVIDQLMHRFNIQSKKHVRNYPFLMGQGIWIDSDKLGPDDEVGDVLKHGTLSVGFIGLAEALKALIGEHHGESERARKLGYEIISTMRRRVDEESKRTHLNFSLLATPAEGLSGRFVRIDAAKYGKIPGVTDRSYYTNSFHVPVYYPISAFDKIKIEAPYHELTNAGHISYIEMDGDPLQNIDAFEKVVRCMKESGIGYGSINHPVDRDPVCGFTGIIGDTCPQCGRVEGDIPFERIRRITGYLVGTLDRFNDGKRAEEHDRVKHGMSQH